ncbi:MAG: KTSC domain-containing protein [Methanobrevibacter sp.]|nr:KTSC domain-containing protein [Methanobrevibacter sp.]
MIHVRSSNLNEVGYDSTSQILTIRFNNGTVYEYYHVPEQVYNGLMFAGSKGSYHHRNIRGHYSYRRIR